MRRYHNRSLNACKCRLCNVTMHNKEALLRHKICHLSCDNFRCILCPEHFMNFHELVEHNYDTHFELHHRCNLCFMYFADLDNLKKHNSRNTWAVPRAFPCNFCCRNFNSVAELDSHKRLHGAECNCNGKTCVRCNKFRCMCGLVFKAHQFIQFMLHMRECYRCSSCNKKFNSAHDRDSHELVHSQQCVICKKRVRNEQVLKQHMTNHNCHCPANNRNCLFCKKAWCTMCRHRFLRSELAQYQNHVKVCKDSDLLCICGEDDCIICQNSKCPFCFRVFRKQRFFGFSSHVKTCKGESDPFAPAPKRMKIKDEPIDIDLTRPKRVIHSTPIAVDSDSDHEKELEESESGAFLAAIDDEMLNSNADNIEIIGSEVTLNMEFSQEDSPPPLSPSSSAIKESPNKQKEDELVHNIIPDNPTLYDIAPQDQRPSRQNVAVVRQSTLSLSQIHSANPAQVFASLTPMTPASNPQASTSSSSVPPDADGRNIAGAAGYINITPQEEQPEVPPPQPSQPAIINICPEGPLPEEMDTFENNPAPKPLPKPCFIVKFK